MLELVIIILYLAGMIAIGVINRKKARDADGFFVAHRKGTTLLIIGSLLATILGGSAVIGVSGLGFTQGLTGMWWLLAGSIGLLILGIFLARKVRRFGLYTLPEMVEKQYDSRVAMIASLLIVIAWTGIIAGQIVAAAKIMGVLDIGSVSLWMVISAAIFVTYTVIGGQYSILRTDTVQAGIICGGILVGVIVLVIKLGGVGGLTESLPSSYFGFPLSSQFDILQLVTFLVIVGATYVVGPDMYSRLFCARDEKTARNAVLWVALILVPLALCIVFVGMGAKVLFPEAMSEQAFPLVMQELLPPVVFGIILAALLAAVMSSADTCLLTTSTILNVDVIRRLRPSMSEKSTILLTRVGIVVLGAVSLAIALALGGVIASLMFAYTVYTCGLVLPVIAGFYKRELKVTAVGAMTALIVGGGIGLAGKILFKLGTEVTVLGVSSNHWDLAGVVICGVVLFGVSFINRRLNLKTSHSCIL